MKDRLLVLGLAVIMFLAGMAFSRLLDEKGAEEAPYESFASKFELEFELSKKRSHYLRELLRFHYQKRSRIEAHHKSTLDTQMGRELDEEDRKFMALIRDKVLPPHQRELFDDRLAGTETLFPAR
ncbi:MAG: hypothetical protein P1V35_05715 [Planctomycetota bacterium]|nr:hypothetical protein [Planctomycetota bacterium]